MSIASEITRLQDAKSELPEILRTKGVTVPEGARLDELIRACNLIQYPNYYTCPPPLYEGLMDGLNGPKGFRQSISSQEIMQGSLNRFLQNMLYMNATKPSYRDSMSEITWEDVQYCLIHGTWPVNIQAVNNEAPYYWWKDGGEGVPAPLTPGIEDSEVRTIMEAAYRHSINKNVHAFDSLTPEILADYRFVKNGAGATWEDLEKFTADNLDTFISLIDDLASNVYLAGDNYKLLNWEQVQYYLLHQRYLKVDDEDLPGIDQLWWKLYNRDLRVPGAATPLDEFWQVMTDYSNGAITEMELKSQVDFYYRSGRLGIYAGTVGKPVPYESSTAINKADTKTRLITLTKVVKSQNLEPYYNSETGVTRFDWDQLQYYAHDFNNITASATEIADFVVAMNYCDDVLNCDWWPWWLNYTPITDLGSLVFAAERANRNYPEAMNTLTMQMIRDFHLRADFKGREFVDDELKSLKTTLKQYALDVGASDMNSAKSRYDFLQYYLIHGELAANIIISENEAKKYYWWQNGGDGSDRAVAIDGTSVTPLMEAAYRSHENGNLHAWDNFSSDLLSQLRLFPVSNLDTSDASTYPSRDDLPKYRADDLAAVRAKLEALLTEVLTSEGRHDKVTWYQIQHYLNAGSYLADAEIDKDVYWWRLEHYHPNNPVGKSGEERFNELLVICKTMQANEIKDWVTWDKMSAMGFYSNLSKPYEATTVMTSTKSRLSSLKNKAISGGYVDSGGNITLNWYQVQYYIAKNMINDTDLIINSGVIKWDVPAWAKLPDVTPIT